MPLDCSSEIHTVGNPAYLSDESKELTLRVHDECKCLLPQQTHARSPISR
jgi:hypothetical protein